MPKELTETMKEFQFMLLQKEEGTEEIELAEKSDN